MTIFGISDEDLIAGLRLARRLPAFLRRPATVEAARATLASRLQHRVSAFLALLERAVYGRPGSPYHVLLRHAGCAYGDLERLVTREGIEGALAALWRAGVYLTVDEFKGRRLVARGSLTLAVTPRLCQNPASAVHVPAGTSGSRGAGVPVPIDLRFLRDRAVNTLLGLEARDGAGWVKAHWQVPGGGAIARLVEFAGFGAPPVRWFSQIDPRDPALHPRYRWSARLLRWSSAAAGAPLPSPEHVPLEAPLRIARWMADVLRAGRVPHLFTFASSGVRLCQAAQDAGIDIAGAQLTVTGEPLTAARLAAIRAAGVAAVPRYAVMECGAIGLGCLAPVGPDEVHLLHDVHAVIQSDPGPGPDGSGPAPLFVTSLGPTAPFILLNVAVGDEAAIDRRACGCPLERLGWTTHLRGVRSHEKLTAGGMTFLGVDVVRVLEVRLPRRFGGGPTDYQLVEDEGPGGQPRLTLVVSPALASVTPDAVAREFLEAVSTGPGAERVMGLLWRDAGFLRVEHRPPAVTASGKLLHLHVGRGVGEGEPGGHLRARKR